MSWGNMHTRIFHASSPVGAHRVLQLMITPRVAKKGVCALVILGLAYIDYSTCYVVGYKEIYLYRLKPAAIVLWVLFGLLESSMFLYWILLFVKGPGRCVKTGPIDIYGADSSLLPVPDAFLCDEQGFPFWCPKCNSLKQQRLFHLGDLDYCVPKFDHFCMWVGTVIGRDNLVFFFRFLQFFDALFVLILCFVAVSTRLAWSRSSESRPHYVILYVLCWIWIMPILALYFVLIYFLSKNWTSLDAITTRQTRAYERYEKMLAKGEDHIKRRRIPRKELGVRYINVAHSETRKVVAFSVNDSPYNLGFKANVVSLMFAGNRSDDTILEKKSSFPSALLFFLVPYSEFFLKRPHKSELALPDDFSPQFIKSIHEKIANGEFSYASYLQHKVSNLDTTSISPET